MRFTKQLETEIRDTLTKNRWVCVVFPAEMYRPDMQIVVHRNNLSMLMHRYLYTTMIGPLTRQQYLLATCKTPGCMNPFHREIAKRPTGTVVRTQCPNGHEYTPENLMPFGWKVRCRICYTARIAKTRKSGEYPRPNVCSKGHDLVEGNLYLHRDKAGQTHRRCRACTLAQMRARRANRSVSSSAHTEEE